MLSNTCHMLSNFFHMLFKDYDTMICCVKNLICCVKLDNTWIVMYFSDVTHTLTHTHTHTGMCVCVCEKLTRQWARAGGMTGSIAIARETFQELFIKSNSSVQQSHHHHHKVTFYLIFLSYHFHKLTQQSYHIQSKAKKPVFTASHETWDSKHASLYFRIFDSKTGHFFMIGSSGYSIFFPWWKLIDDYNGKRISKLRHFAHKFVYFW